MHATASAKVELAGRRRDSNRHTVIPVSDTDTGFLTESGTANPPAAAEDAVLYRIFTERLGQPYPGASGWTVNRTWYRKGSVVNKTKTVATGVAAFAAVAVIGACSNSATKEATSSAAPSTTQTSSAAPAGVHNQADMHFAKTMIPHHQQAIEMSDIILAKQGIDPQVVDLATQIKAAQGPEIEQMQGWMSQWGAGCPG